MPWVQLGPGGVCHRGPGTSVLDHAVYLSPLVDVLLAHDVRVDEEVPVPHAEVFLAGGAFEALKVINFVLHPHGHLVGADPLLAGGAQPVLPEEPATTRAGAEHSSSAGQLGKTPSKREHNTLDPFGAVLRYREVTWKAQLETRQHRKLKQKIQGPHLG